MELEGFKQPSVTENAPLSNFIIDLRGLNSINFLTPKGLQMPHILQPAQNPFSMRKDNTSTLETNTLSDSILKSEAEGQVTTRDEGEEDQAGLTITEDAPEASEADQETSIYTTYTDLIETDDEGRYILVEQRIVNLHEVPEDDLLTLLQQWRGQFKNLAPSSLRIIQQNYEDHLLGTYKQRHYHGDPEKTLKLGFLPPWRIKHPNASDMRARKQEIEVKETTHSNNYLRGLWWEQFRDRDLDDDSLALIQEVYEEHLLADRDNATLNLSFVINEQISEVATFGGTVCNKRGECLRVGVIPEDNAKGLKLAAIELRRENGKVMTDLLRVPNKEELEKLITDSRFNSVPTGMTFAGVMSGLSLSVLMAMVLGHFTELSGVSVGLVSFIPLVILGGAMGTIKGESLEKEKYNRSFLHLFDSSRDGQKIEIRNGQFSKLVHMLSTHLNKHRW